MGNYNYSYDAKTSVAGKAEASRFLEEISEFNKIHSCFYAKM
jgi:hypothetical protein